MDDGILPVKPAPSHITVGTWPASSTSLSASTSESPNSLPSASPSAPPHGSPSASLNVLPAASPTSRSRTVVFPEPLGPTRRPTLHPGGGRGHARGEVARAEDGRAPVVTDGDLVLAESGAIVEYFVEKTGRLGPQTPSEKVSFRFFMHYAEGSVMPPLLVRLLMSKVKSAPLPFFIKPIAASVADQVDAGYSDGAIERHFTLLSRQLPTREWLLGDRLTAADVQMLYPLEAGLSRGAGHRPHIKAWLDRVQARPAYQRAIQKGGPLVPPA